MFFKILPDPYYNYLTVFTYSKSFCRNSFQRNILKNCMKKDAFFSSLVEKSVVVLKYETDVQINKLEQDGQN
jgi:hypothetical protein